MLSRCFFRGPRASLKSFVSMTRTFSSTSDVIRTTMNTCGVFTLNRPKALNTLNLSMVKAMYPQLKQWDEDKNISHVIIEGVGDRSFCAGGDIVTLTTEGKSSPTAASEFFRDEYLVNHKIGTLSIPYIALLDGFVMGGGVGVSVHGSHRVATERTLFAMPETAIGLFPDVGGGHFLPRLKGELGTFLGLTGFRLRGSDVVKAGIATHFVDSDKIDDLKETLIGVENASRQDIDSVLKSFQDSSQFDSSSRFVLEDHLEEIDLHFGHHTIEAIMKSLGGPQANDWSRKHLETLRMMSPTSMKVTLRQLREGKNLSLADCLKMEYRLGVHCLMDKDLYEGVRAVLVDRDNAPKWSPDSVEEVADQKVDWYFSSEEVEREWTC